MLQSVINGNGRMAQFNHPEFAGSGQWMSGGMTMVSDMFNNNLKASVSKQSYGGSLSFNSQYGLVDVARLPVVSDDGVAQTAQSNQSAPAPAGMPPQTTTDNAAGLDIFAAIDKLAELRSRNILTEAEFDAKKAELLARL